VRYIIEHDTIYEFSSKVYLEPHLLRFKPRNTPQLKVESFKLSLDPIPDGISESTDVENNFVHRCWFLGAHRQLKITSSLTVEIPEYNPFGFIIYPFENQELPVEYQGKSGQLLQQSMSGEKIHPKLMAYGESILKNAKEKTIDFLLELTRQIHNDFQVQVREQGSPEASYNTFESRIGSCRDLSWMQIQLLRNMGLAARFVSGYFYPMVEDPEFELHAWVEVYLPGAGWLGFDPSHGLIAGHQHIPVASSAYYQHAMTVAGTYRGDAKSDLNTSLSIQRHN